MRSYKSRPRARDIDEAVRFVSDTGCDSVETVALEPKHPLACFSLDAQGRMRPLFPDDGGGAAASGVYKPTGAVYVMRYATLMEDGGVRGKDHRGLLRGPEVSVDVDTPLDLRIAEWYLKRKEG